MVLDNYIKYAINGLLKNQILTVLREINIDLSGSVYVEHYLLLELPYSVSIDTTCIL